MALADTLSFVAHLMQIHVSEPKLPKVTNIWGWRLESRNLEDAHSCYTTTLANQ